MAANKRKKSNNKLVFRRREIFNWKHVRNIIKGYI